MAKDERLLTPEEVEYIAFEGGGGKGNAYLGAIKAIWEMILTKENSLKGYAGASAGAITALLLASGYSHSKIKEILSTDFNRFFDFPEPGKKIIAGENLASTPDPLDAQASSPALKSKIAELEAFGKKMLDEGTSEIKEAFLATLNISELVKKSIKDITTLLISGSLRTENPVLATKLRMWKNRYWACVMKDLGLFSGFEIHNFFNKIIKAKYSGSGSKGWVNFEDHYKFFGKKLKFTAVNLTTQKVHILSKETTPKLPVATAARMSMSLPLVYKPVIFNKKALSKYELVDSIWGGFWVDGGLFNNAPVQVFDSDKSLLFRLGNHDERNEIDSILSLFKVWFLKVGVLGSGSGQISESTFKYYYQHLITLDTTGTSLLKFNLPPYSLGKLEERNYEITKKYFQDASLQKQLEEVEKEEEQYPQSQYPKLSGQEDWKDIDQVSEM
ncbi:MAG: patatin-like phospholipase family protein [Phaeodactylibacter sp.]|nr:patatin-like phospholipase family protein [Phaeodactylibacter sp.]